MWGIGVLIAIYCGLFFLQKIIVIYAERRISKFVPVIILFALSIIYYIWYIIDLAAMKRRGAITMAIDSAEILFYIGEAIILTAAVICIAGFIYGTYCKWRMKKIPAKPKENKFQIRL